jgi:putative ABC transport system permease protein
MNLLDMIILGFENLWRTKLRTTLTVIGVVVGIGALTSMISFGTGMQKNITDAFKNNNLFTSLTVTSQKIDVQQMMSGNFEVDTTDEDAVPLTDSVVLAIQQIPGVEIAFPEVTFPAKLRMGNSETNTTVQAVPAQIGEFKPYNDLLGGSFFSHDSADAAVIRWETLRRMKRVVDDPENPFILTGKDSLDGVKIIAVDSIVGKNLDLISAVIRIPRIPLNPIRAMQILEDDPFSEKITHLRITGILKRSSPFTSNIFSGGIMIPMKTADQIPRVSFDTVLDFLSNREDRGKYQTIHVRVEEIKDLEPVRMKLEEMGVEVFTITDQFKELKRGFLIMDTILGAIGTIALFVASLGIINTMIMSILERTRDIGIMKAIGGAERDIRKIFFVEAASIGFLGALFGLILGWGVTRVANFVANTKLMPQGEAPIDLFYFPLWLILGAVAFSMVVSLVAGLYPAIRAARIDPVKALRHD